MKKRFMSMLLVLCMVFTLFPQTAFAAETGGATIGNTAIGTTSVTEGAPLCENHKVHDTDCGYIEAKDAQPCGDLLEDGSYSCAPVKDSGDVSGNTATPGDAGKKYVCDHSDGCGYAVAGAPCTHQCALCTEQPAAPKCSCTVKCVAADTENGTAESIYGDCPVCGIAGADLSACVGEAALLMMQPRGVVQEVPNRTDLQNAITNATGDVSIKLSDSYTDTVGKLTIGDVAHNFTIDLNGKTLDGGSSSAIVHSGTGTLTITDSSSSPGKVTNASSDSFQSTIYFHAGNLEITGGTVENTSTGTSVAIYNRGADTLSVSGGTVSSGGSSGTIMLTSGSLGLEIKGGTVKSTGTGHAIYNVTSGTVTVSDGIVSATTGEAIYNNSTGTVTVSGGTVENTGTGTAIYNNSTGKITISDNAQVISANTSTGTIWLNGGAATDTVLEITGGTVENTSTSGTTIYNKADGKITVQVTDGSTAIVKGGGKAMSKAPTLVDTACEASTAKTDGSELGDYDSNAIASYKYLKFTRDARTPVATPNATITATGADSGELSGLTASANYKYSTNGGTSYTDFTGATTTIASGITTTNGVWVVAKGDGTTTKDSVPQKITVTQATTPTVGKTDCTTAENNDGKITGVSSTMEYKLVTATGWTTIAGGDTVVGLANGTYNVRVKATGTTLASPNATVTIGAFVKLTPTTSDLSCSLTAVNYDGNPKPVSVTAKDSKNLGVITVKYTGSTTAPTNAGTYAITVDTAGSDDYTAATGLSLGNFTINKIAYTGTTAVSASVAVGGQAGATVTLPTLPEGASYGTPTPSGDITMTGIGISDTTLTYTAPANTAGKTGIMTIPVTSATNYIDYNIVVTVTYTAKTPQAISYTAANVNKTYGDGNFTNALTQTTVNGAITYASDDTAVATVNSTTGEVTIVGYGTDGSATITATAAETSTHAQATASYTVTVAKKALTLKAENKTMTKGGTLPTFTYTETGLVNGDTVTTAPTMATTADGKTAGTFDITISGGVVTNAANYTITHTKGTLTVSDSTPGNSTITPTAAAFDKYTGATGYADVAVTQTINGNTLTAIKNGTTALTGGTDYTVSGNTITIKKEYLAQRAAGTVTLTFDYSAGIDPTLTITVSDSTPIATHTITASAGTGGSISPSGSVTVNNGESKTFTISANSNYSISSVTVDGVNQGSISTYTFSNVTANHTISASFSYNGSGSTGGDGGGSSSGGGSNIIVTPPAPDKPNTPTEAEIKVDGKTDANGNTTITVTDKNITDAITKAEADAKKNGNTANGITIVLSATGGKNATNVTVNLPKTVQDLIISKKVVSTIIVVDNPDVQIGMDLKAVTEINKQAKSDVNITAQRLDSGKLTGTAKTAMGSRPVFNLAVNYGSGKQVQSFGAGGVSVTIPYTLGANEKAGNVCAVYVDGSGKVQWLTSSVYDNAAKVLRFSTNHFSTYGVGYKQDAPAFTDIANHWAKSDIEYVVSRGLFAGTGATTFSPNTAQTRGMFVTALGRLANADVSNYKTSSFSDVKADSYYMGYIEWANKNGIVNGSDGKFMPDQSITREQMAVIMQNYAKVIGFTLPKVHEEKAFADSAKISGYAKDAVKAMQMAGVLSGKSGNVFDPQGTATRAEVSAVLRRFVELRISIDTAQGWTMNDSGKWMYYENGKPVTGKKDIGGVSYTFDQNGEMADIPKI